MGYCGEEVMAEEEKYWETEVPVETSIAPWLSIRHYAGHKVLHICRWYRKYPDRPILTFVIKLGEMSVPELAKLSETIVSVIKLTMDEKQG
jgi:hypothetical protein